MKPRNCNEITGNEWPIKTNGLWSVSFASCVVCEVKDEKWFKLANEWTEEASGLQLTLSCW